MQKNVNFSSIKNVIIKYVQNLIDDQILRYFKFCFCKKFKNSYVTVEKIIEDLRCIYNNSNRRFIVVN